MKSPRTLRGYPVKERIFQLGGAEIRLLGPANFEELVDDPRVVARFEVDEFMPYWAEFWPATMLLARIVADWPPVGDPRPRVLELGCGLGLVALLAARRGYDVIASDYEDDALAFVAETARFNGLPPPEGRFIDWRKQYTDLRFDHIVACEVLYELRNLAPIAGFIAGHLRPGGTALLVDSYRQTADGFADVARAAGLQVEVTALDPHAEDKGCPRGRMFTVTRGD